MNLYNKFFCSIKSKCLLKLLHIRKLLLTRNTFSIIVSVKFMCTKHLLPPFQVRGDLFQGLAYNTNSSLRPTFTEGSKGGRLLVFQGFNFSKQREFKKTTNWQCSRSVCIVYIGSRIFSTFISFSVFLRAQQSVKHE
jgi:hypothetical protein